MEIKFGDENAINMLKAAAQKEKDKEEQKKAPICDSRYVEVMQAQAQFKCNFCKEEFWEEFEGYDFEEHKKCPKCNEWLKLRANV